MSDESNQQKEKWDEIKEIWRNDKSVWLIAGLLLGLLLGFLLGISSTADIDHWFLAGMWPNILTAVITIGVIDRLIKAQNKQTEEERLKKDLLWQVQSRSTDVAVSAIDRLRHEGWLLGDKSVLKEVKFSISHPPKWAGAQLERVELQGMFLSRADLKNANLENANLANCHIYNADLSEADMTWVNLGKANLSSSNLSEAKLTWGNMKQCNLLMANLQKTWFMQTNLDSATLCKAQAQNAIFFDVNLRNANLSGANLSGAYLLGSDVRGVIWTDIVYGSATLPDGSVYKKEEDISRFVDPYHKNLWLPPSIIEKGQDQIYGHIIAARLCVDNRNAAN